MSLHFNYFFSIKCLIWWKSTKNHPFVQTLQVFEQTTMFWHFHELFSKKLQKVPHFVKKHEKSSIWPKLCNFLNKLPCLWISINFWGKGWKRGSFREKARKIIDLSKTCNFSKKLPCFCISMNFSEKGCKKCLISWKSTKNHRFGQNFATFRTIYHVFAFRWTFKEKFGKSASFREKARKNIDLAKTLQLFEQTTMFLHFDEQSSKKLQKAAHAVKKHEKSSIWPKLATLSSKLPCFGISMKFSARSCKKCLVSWKSTKNHRFGQILATFRTNYHVFAFRWTFQEEVAKSASFREKGRKLVDLAKTCNFSKKLPCFGISMIIAGKSCKKWFVSWKSTKNHRFGQNFATFRTNYHVFAFGWTFKEKVGKGPSFREKARKIIDLVKTCKFSKKLPGFDVSMKFSARSCKKCVISWQSTKNHRFGQNFATFRTIYHVFAFGWTFKEKVGKSASFREKPRKIIDLAKTLQLLE